jgi:hypothetical protein
MRIIEYTLFAGTSPFMQFRFGADIQALSLMEQIDWEELPFVGSDGERLPQWEQDSYAEKYGGRPQLAKTTADIGLALIRAMSPSEQEDEPGVARSSTFAVVKEVMEKSLEAAAAKGCELHILAKPYIDPRQ